MDELQKNDLVELTVDNLGYDGEGIARYDGKTIFIKGALPGERIRAKIIAVRPKFNIALLEKVLSPSSNRVTPVCPLFNKCGGCDIQHLSYDAQLAFKQKMVAETLKKVGGIDFPVSETVASENTTKYRNKISLPVRRTKNGVSVGLFAKGSHRIVETDECLLQKGGTSALIHALKDFIKTNALYGYDEEQGKGDIRHLVARPVSGKLSVTLVSNKIIDCKDFVESVKKISSDCEVYLNINRRRDNIILGDEWHLLYSSNTPSIVDGLCASVHPGGFFQVNDEIRSLLYGEVASLCSGGFAVEAYSGAGLLSASLCKKADEVHAIEINEKSHESALKLKKDNALSNFFPVCGDVSVLLPEVLKKAKGKNTFIVLDPPRTGISRECATTLLASNSDNIVYISCNPATLARDLALLKEKYSPVSITPFDMFPQTSNVETLVVLRKQNS